MDDSPFLKVGVLGDIASRVNKLTLFEEYNFLKEEMTKSNRIIY
jgi:hypothetical protein